MSPYMPPYRRPQAAGGSVPDVSLDADTPYRDHRHRQGGVGRHGEHHKISHEGVRELPRGSSRGGPGCRDRPERRNIDDSDIISGHDITRYFWPRDDDDEIAQRLEPPSTFHSSTAHQDQLSYMLLFMSANPRWASDAIVFANCALALLPEYTEQKVKCGPWNLPVRSKEETGEGITRQDTIHAEAGRTEDEASEATGQDGSSTSGSSIQYNSQTENERIHTKVSSTENSTEDAAPNAPPNPSIIRIVPASKVYTDTANPTYPSIPPIDYKPGPHSPVAVFQEVQSISRNAFVFIGWHRVSRVNIIAPNSAELVRMQQQMWERQDRFGSVTAASRPRGAWAWQSSMKHEWAVVKFEKLRSKAAPPKPEIGMTEEAPANLGAKPGERVAGMLEDMRLGDGDVAVGKSGDAGGEKNVR